MDPDGGWNTTSFNIDRTKLYRFSMWMKTDDTTPASTSGYSYLGCEWSTVSFLGAGEAVNSNPYFWVGTLPLNDWYLVVGYVQPYGYTGTTSYGRVYNRQGTEVAYCTDFKWLSTSTITKQRAYLFYCNELGIQQEFWNPRVEIVNSVNDPIDVLFQTPEASPKNITLALPGAKTIQALSYSSTALPSSVVTATYPDNNDSDSDGLPDGWETQYFGNLSQEPYGDWDADGISNVREYQTAGNPASGFGLEVFTRLLKDTE